MILFWNVWIVTELIFHANGHKPFHVSRFKEFYPNAFQYISSPEDGYKTIRDMFANPVEASNCMIAPSVIASALIMFMFHFYGGDSCLCLYHLAVWNNDTVHFALNMHTVIHILLAGYCQQFIFCLWFLRV